MPLNFNSSKTNTGNPDTAQKSKASEKPTIDFIVSSPKYTFDDLILSKSVLDELDTVVGAQKCWNKVFSEWNLGSVMRDKTNLLVNLYGDPGTGKTMAAHAIAHDLNKEILCVNYADVESKYVGETGKNLMALFEFAKSRDVIIFFDEADALLSKRVTNMNNATDVSVNQTRSVLLTLLNEYKGMVIFATNFVSNYDPAFMRRIQYHVRFRLPDKMLREKLWRKYIPREMLTDLNYVEIAEEFSDISGSDISTAVLNAALRAAKNNEGMVKSEYFCEAIKSVIDSKKANAGSDDITVTTREVSEEYVKEKVRKGAKLVDLTKK